jgi:hypothetical protein
MRRRGFVHNKWRATAFLLIAVAVFGTGVSQAAPKPARRVAKPSSRPKPTTPTTTMIARPCGATTFPRQPEDGLAFTQDVDGDGVFDLTVANSLRSELRVAFSGGPEVAIPLPSAAGGRISVWTLKAPWDPKVFVLRWLMASSGFSLESHVVFRREGCRFVKLPFASDPTALTTNVSRTFGSIGSGRGIVDSLRCDGNDIFRVRHSTIWTSFSTFTTTVWKWQYSYTSSGFQLVKVFEEETKIDVPGEYVPVGSNCFTDESSLFL